MSPSFEERNDEVFISNNSTTHNLNGLRQSNGVDHPNNTLNNGIHIKPVSINGVPNTGTPVPSIQDAQSNGTNVAPAPTNGAINAESFIPHIQEAQNSSSSNAFESIPMAVCGLALRLPSGLKTPQQFWDFLLAGGDARTQVPESRYNVSAFHDTTGKPTTVPTEYGYFLEDDLGALDTSFFSMPRVEVERINPEQRLMLEVTRECLEDAGESNWKGKPIGCYVGSFGEDWVEMAARETQQYGQYRLTGIGDFVLSNRVSYELNLTGPSVTIRTACSASLTALNEACLALSRGDCQSAVVGGTNLLMTTNMTTAMSDHGVLAKDGNCKTFSADADGYARGEAAVAIYVKRLSDAIKDGNPIRAVIRGTAINSDGKTPGLSCPSTTAHEAVMRRAYAVAGIDDFSQTAFVECHGTGTPTGDPIETKAVARVFGGEKGVLIGSVKPNIGHTEGASGLVSVIKCILALENRIIPPNIKMRSPNPAIPWDAGLSVPLKPTPWPQDRCERVSINSFGAGGANAHVILDSAASFNATIKPQEPQGVPDLKSQLLLLSATSQKSLSKLVQNYSEFVEHNPDRITDLAYTLAMRREHLPHRAYMIASQEGVCFESQGMKPSSPPSIVMVFTGQGAQWPQMARELMRNNQTFLSTIRSLDKYLKTAARYTSEWDWTIEEELRKPPKRSRIHTAELAQPLCAAFQIALVDSFREFGIQPSAVVGHSSGEIVAAYATGALTAEEAIFAAMYRGIVASGSTRKGAMAAVGMSWEETEKYLTGVSNVGIACDNSPMSVTISGDTDQVESVVAAIKESQPGVLARMLKVDKAYHSYHMAELSTTYQKRIKNLVLGTRPNIPFFSSVTGKLLDSSKTSLDYRYWSANLESPVRFRSAITEAINHPVGQNAVFLEIGPHSALAGPLRQTMAGNGKSCSYVPAVLREQNGFESFLSAIGQLWGLHLPINFNGLASSGSCLPDLPRYPWNHDDSFWFEPRVSREHRQRQFPHHDLLGVKVIESTSFEPAWRNILHLDNAPWVSEHRVGDDIVFPMVGYLGIAGEAIRQVSGVEEGYRIRRFVIHNALMIPEGSPVELITTFRRHRLTDALDSEWWEFTIASHNGSAWTKHCNGQITAQSESLGLAQPPPSQPRQLPAKVLVDTAAQGGVNLGPSYHHYGELSGDTKSQRTVGKIYNGRHKDAHKYFLHPCLMDSLVQIAIFTQTDARRRKFEKNLPIGLEELSVSRCTTDFSVDTWVELANGLVPVGKAQCVADGQVVISMSGLKLAASSGSDDMDRSDPHAAAKQVWAPDFDLLDTKEQVRPFLNTSADTFILQELSLQCLVYLQRQLASVDTEGTHIHGYRTWIDEQCKGVAASRFEDLRSFENVDILEKIQELVDILKGTPLRPASTALLNICNNLESLVVERQNSWEAISDRETIEQLHHLLKDWDLKNLVHSMAHSRPNLRVLEIDSGTGAPSTQLQDLLTRPDGQVVCSKYVFASNSFVSGQENSTKFPRMEYGSLDIQKDPAEQDFEGQLFDLVIASNISAHSTSSQASLRNLKSLLQPSGCLVTQDFCFDTVWAKLILGTHLQWQSRLATDEGDSTLKRLREELSTIGFEDVEVVCADQECVNPGGLLAVARNRPRLASSKNISLLHDPNTHSPDKLVYQLQKNGYHVSTCTLQDTVPAGQDVIALLDQNGPFFENLESTQFTALKEFILRLENSGILWITRQSQMIAEDPRYAQVFGFARVVRTELLVDFGTCEVNDLALESADVVRVLEKFQLRPEDDTLKPEYEYAIHQSVIHVSRYYPFTLSEELLDTSGGDRVDMDIATPGRLNTLKWVRNPNELQIEPNEVEIEIHAVGVNFRDVLVGLKVVDTGSRVFGLEGAGIVRRAGSEITHVKPGDRVAAMGYHMFASVVKTLGVGCVKIPDDWSFADASVLICPWVTAMHALMTVAGLKKGQSVLIHSACGGVGLTAIELAIMLEAEIYATVGNEEKIEFLVNNYGIPRNKIFSSRNDSFTKGIKRETSGRGVDVVLNSLSGELLHASWRCVAPFGKLIEIGKRDLMGYGKLDMDVFLANRSYCCIDIGANPETRPVEVPDHISRIIDWVRQGKIQPARRVKAFDANSLYEAFRYLQPGTHIGRICVELRQSSQPGFIGTVSPVVKLPKFNPSASYVLVGGLGGLGRAVSRWMVEHGARNLIFLSRSAGDKPDDQLFVKELQSMDCEVQLVRGSVTNYDDVARVVQEAIQPVKGILQMSMVLRDQGLPKMTAEEWNEAVSPKIQGTWNLHNASLSYETKLDFFVLFSSLSSTVGQHGQANYASANTFLDSFAQYRNKLGLRACSINIGAVDGIGVISQDDGLKQRLSASGFVSVREQELLDALTVATDVQPQPNNNEDTSSRPLNSSSFVLGLGTTIPLNSPANHAVWKKDRRMAIYHNAASTSVDPSKMDASLKSYISNAKADPTILKTAEAATFFANEIGKTLCGLLIKPAEDLNISMSLADLGLDSLVGVELRAWWRQVFEFDVSIFEMLGTGTLEALGKFAADGLAKKFTKSTEG